MNSWSEQHPIHNEWAKYYKTLEAIRQSGIVNMWGAAPVLAEYEGITQQLAKDVLMSWISNYRELAKIYSW